MAEKPERPRGYKPKKQEKSSKEKVAQLLKEGDTQRRNSARRGSTSSRNRGEDTLAGGETEMIGSGLQSKPD